MDNTFVFLVLAAYDFFFLLNKICTIGGGTRPVRAAVMIQTFPFLIFSFSFRKEHKVTLYFSANFFNVFCYKLSNVYDHPMTKKTRNITSRNVWPRLYLANTVNSIANQNHKHHGVGVGLRMWWKWFQGQPDTPHGKLQRITLHSSSFYLHQ